MKYDDPYDSLACYDLPPNAGVVSSSRRWKNTPKDVLQDVADTNYDTVEVEYVEPQVKRRTSSSPAPKTRDVYGEKERRMIAEDQSRYRRRPHTDEDQVINTRRLKRYPIVKEPQPKLQSRRSFLVKLGLGAAATGGLVLLSSFVVSNIREINNEIAQGQNPDAQLSLVCGHDDSAEFPTMLTAYVLKDRKIQVNETSSKTDKLLRYFVTDTIQFTGPLNQVNLKFTSSIQASGKYEVLLTATEGGVGAFVSQEHEHWLFVDSGKGYFVGAQPKQ